MKIENIHLLIPIIESKMNSGDYQAALEETMKIKDSGLPPLSFYIAGSFLIDIGYELTNDAIIQDGINLLQKMSDSSPSYQILKHRVLYNLANGFSRQFSLKYNINKLAGYFKTTTLSKAIKYYLEALNCADARDSDCIVQIWINLGNCLKESGRIIEAFECYEEALEISPHYGMAMANKGEALSYYAHISGDHFDTFIKDAYRHISEALELGVLPESRDYFLRIKHNIEFCYPNLIKNIDFSRFPGIKIDGEPNLENYSVQYCLDNHLYLNICNVCQKCSAAVGDTLGIKEMLVHANPGVRKTDPFLRLSSYLNQMKQDYVTARLLLIQSRFKDSSLHFVDKKVTIIDTLDSVIPNIYIQLCRFAFKGFYDILDKIASFINDYLHIGMNERKINFTNIWYSNFDKKIVHTKILDIKNLSLNAIYNLSEELDVGRYYKLKEIRNALTHRFLYITPLTEAVSEENMLEEKFVEHTIALAKLVRNALLYLMHFVHIEEQKKLAMVKKSSPIPIKEMPANSIPYEKKVF